MNSSLPRAGRKQQQRARSSFLNAFLTAFPIKSQFGAICAQLEAGFRMFADAHPEEILRSGFQQQRCCVRVDDGVPVDGRSRGPIRASRPTNAFPPCCGSAS